MSEMHTMYTEEQKRSFERYCNALIHLVERDHGSFGGVVSRGKRGDCCECHKPMPAGIPVELAGGTYDYCPPCVDSKRLDKVITTQLNVGHLEPTPAERLAVLQRLIIRKPTATGERT